MEWPAHLPIVGGGGVSVRHYLYAHFLNRQFLFGIHIACMIFILFIIAKGLAMCRLGGVISTQIVLF